MKKENNPEYISLNFFRDKAIDKTIRKTYLNEIFINLVIENNLEEIENKITSITKDEIKEIGNTLFNITYFCIEYNYPGKEICQILNDDFDIDLDISESLITLYNQNKLSLKLDFIINNLTHNDE